MKKKKEQVIEKMLLEKYDKYYRIALRYTKNEHDALDVVQEGAYKAMISAEKLKNSEYADTWICRIMMNEAIEFLRKNQKYETEFQENENSAETAEESGDYEDLKEAMDKLPLKDQTVILLRFFEDMSLEQMSEVLDENVSTIKSRLYRALAKLKIQLS